MFLKEVTALLSTQLLGRVIRFLYLVLIARYLEPDEVGLYLYGIALYLGVVGIAQFGQNIFLSERIGKHHHLPRPAVRNSFTLTFISTSLVTVLLSLYIIYSEMDTGHSFAMLFFAGALFSRTFSAWTRSVYVALKAPGWIPGFEIKFRGLEAACGFIALALGGGLLEISALHFAFWTLEAFLSLLKLESEFPGLVRLSAQRRYLTKVISVSKYYLLGTTALALFGQVAILLIRHLEIESNYLGYFAVSMQLFSTFLIIPEVISNAFLPRLSLSFSQGKVGEDLITAIKLVSIISLLTTILSTSLGSWAITFFLGEKYTEASELFKWLSWAIIPYSLSIFIGKSLNVIGLRRYSTAIMLIMLIMHSGLIILFANEHIQFATIGSLFIASAAGALLFVFRLSLKFSLNMLDYWKKFTLTSIAAYTIIQYDNQSLITSVTALITIAVAIHYLKMFNSYDNKVISNEFHKHKPW